MNARIDRIVSNKKLIRDQAVRRILNLIELVLALLLPYMCMKLALAQLYRADLDALKAMSQLLTTEQGSLVIGLTFFYCASLLGFAFACIYVLAAIFGYRISWRREGKSIWHI